MSNEHGNAKAVVIVSNPVCFLLCLLGASSGAAPALGAEPLPTDFYIVWEVVSDASPFWYHYILDVKPDGRDSVVRYIRIAPDGPCPGSVVVQAQTARLPDVSPSDLASSYNLCAADTTALNRRLQKRIRRTEVDDSVRFGIVANCGATDAVLHLPFPEQVKLEALSKRSPDLARWWDFPYAVKERAFGSREVFYGVSPDQEVQLQQEGASAVAELRSGRFDKGLGAYCSHDQPCGYPRSFRFELNKYGGPLGSDPYMGQLLHADRYQFQRYVPPKYPAAAHLARISGTVTLDLTVDPATGVVKEARATGYSILRDAAAAAARQWQFVPNTTGASGEPVPATVRFEFICPQPPQ